VRRIVWYLKLSFCIEGEKDTNLAIPRSQIRDRPNLGYHHDSVLRRLDFEQPDCLEDFKMGPRHVQSNNVYVLGLAARPRKIP